MSCRPIRNFIILSLLALGVHSQDPKTRDQRPTEPVARIETELVQLDVVVVDRAGKLVGDLKREAFEILEEGKAQQITHFAVGNARQPAVWLTTEKKPRTQGDATTVTPVEIRGHSIVLMVDDLHLAPENLILAKRTLHRFVENQLSGSDQIAIATTSGTLGLYQQFTTERAVLARAINRLSLQQRQAMTPLFDVPRITDYQAELIDMGDAEALELAVQEILLSEPPQPTGGRIPRSGTTSTPGSGGAGGGEAGMSARDRAAQTAKSKARSIIAENVNYTNATLGSLEGVVRSLRDMPGRKLLVLVSDGFFLGGSTFGKHFDLRRITDAATRAGVVIYSLDARGLIATPPGGDASQPSAPDVGMPGARSRIESGAIDAKRDGINALARDTGGFLVMNTNDLNLGLQRVLDDNETYYVLAWEPETTYRDGRFRKIEVRIPGRPELRVRTRKGYFAPDDKEKLEKEKADVKAAEKAKDRPDEKAARTAKEVQLRKGLSSLFPLRAIPIELAADFIDTVQTGTLGVVAAHIDAGQLNYSLNNNLHQTFLDVVTLVFDEKGKVAGNFSERLSLSLKPEMIDQVRRLGFTYRKLVPLKPGFYQVRVAVREEGSGQLGSATRWVEIADVSQKKLTLSSVLLTSTVDDLKVPGVPAVEGPIEYQPRPTQALRRFAKGRDIDFLIFAYNAQVADGKVDLVVQSQVFSGSKLIYSTSLTRVTPDEGWDLQRIPYAARLSLDGFDPGEYELRLLVIDRLAKATADRRVNFTVEK